MTQNDFVTVEHLLSEIVTQTNDADFKQGIPKGRYISWIQKAMQELAIDTFFQKRIIDVPLPANCQLPMPKDTFNIREIYVYNGTLCNPAKSQVVHRKRLFNNMGSGEGYTARIKDDGSNANDIFLPNQALFRRNHGDYSGKKYYWGFFEGTIMLSLDCKSYEFVRIIANGMGGEIGDWPEIPRFFETAVTDFVRVKFFTAMLTRDPRSYSQPLAQAKVDLDDMVKGSWNKARKRVKSMDSAEIESYNEYFSSMLHK